MSTTLVKILREAVVSNNEVNLEDLSLEGLIDLCRETDAVSHKELYDVYLRVNEMLKPIREKATLAIRPMLEKLA